MQLMGKFTVMKEKRQLRTKKGRRIGRNIDVSSSSEAFGGGLYNRLEENMCELCDIRWT